MITKKCFFPKHFGFIGFFSIKNMDADTNIIVLLAI